MEVERLQNEYDVEVLFAPFLLDPTAPAGGKPRRPMSNPQALPSPLEQRGERLGIRFSRGRTLTSNSRLALEAAEYAREKDRAWEFHREMFKAYFEDLSDIGSIDTVARVGEKAGLDGGDLRRVLAGEDYRKLVDEGVAWSRSIGVTAIPTFVFDERLGMVGAQEYPALEHMMGQVGGRHRRQTG